MIAGVWNFKFDAPDGITYTPVLKIFEKGDKFTAKFLASNDAPEKAVEDFKVDGKTISFRTSVELNGSEIKLSYTCKIDGTKITGTCEYEVDGNVGEFDVKAERETTKTESKNPEK